MLATKDYSYDAYGHRLSQTVSGPAEPNGTFTYGYDVHGSVSQLLDASGSSVASYGYKAYGQTDSGLSQGDNDQLNPRNPFRFSAKHVDTGSGTMDMGVRRFGPDVSRFLTPDLFYGALSNLSLSLDPITQNRYGLAGGNPIGFREWDGHMVLADGGGGAASSPMSAQPNGAAAANDCPWWCQAATATGIPPLMLANPNFREGLAEGTGELLQGGIGLGVLAQECTIGFSPLGGQGCAQDLTAIAASIREHPTEYLGSLVAYEDIQEGMRTGDFSKAEGHLLPSIALAAVPGGGAAAKGTEGAGAAAEGGEAVLPRFTQTTASGVFRNGPFAGRSIGDVAADLRPGNISPSDLPVDVISRDGNLLGLNTRSMLALRRAGISPGDWTMVDRTGQGAFEQLLDERLARNGLTNAGTDVLRITGAGPWASWLG